MPFAYVDNVCPFYHLFFCNYIRILLSNIFVLIVVDETISRIHIDSNLEIFLCHISCRLSFYALVFLLFQTHTYCISTFVS